MKRMLVTLSLVVCAQQSLDQHAGAPRIQVVLRGVRTIGRPTEERAEPSSDLSRPSVNPTHCSSQHDHSATTQSDPERSNHTGLRVLGGMLSGVLYLVGAILFFVGLLFFRNCGTYVDTGIGLGEFLDRGAHVAGMFMIPFGALLILIGAVFTWVSLRSDRPKSPDPFADLAIRVGSRMSRA